MHPKVNTHTPPPVNRYINSHRTADTPGGIQRLMCVIFKMKSYYMKKEPVVKKCVSLSLETRLDCSEPLASSTLFYSISA